MRHAVGGGFSAFVIRGEYRGGQDAGVSLKRLARNKGFRVIGVGRRMIDNKVEGAIVKIAPKFGITGRWRYRA